MKIYKYYIDSGHGWLAVKKSELVELGIADKISGYSYQKGETAYLEEDGDAGLFFEAYQAKYGHEPEHASVHQDNGLYPNGSPIRQYDGYTIE